MLPPFDIFRQERGGTVLWLGIANSMEEANEKVAEQLAQIPSSYLIVSLRSGRRHVVSPADGSD
jgi:hypothetical protein